MKTIQTLLAISFPQFMRNLIMLKSKFAVAAVLASALTMAGCATPYQPHGALGGFAETQLDNNVFRIAFSGNAYTSTEKAEIFILTRGAELTLENGYRFFQVIQSSSTTSVHQGRSKPHTSNTIAMFKQRPSEGTSFNAQFVYDKYKYFVAGTLPPEEYEELKAKCTKQFYTPCPNKCKFEHGVCVPKYPKGE